MWKFRQLGSASLGVGPSANKDRFSDAPLAEELCNMESFLGFPVFRVKTQGWLLFGAHASVVAGKSQGWTEAAEGFFF